jgi:hypothetical protein
MASGIYALYNSSQNAVADLWYGGGVNSGDDFRNSYSRHLLYFDLDALRQKIASKDINTALTVTYRLKMRNAVPSDKVLDKEPEFHLMQKAIASSFDLIVFPVDKAWDEGRGYDILKQRSLVEQQGDPRLTGYSNWYSATTTTAWTEPGVFTNPTASTQNYATQHFSIGGEDVSMDVTAMVNDWLSGGSTNHGMCIAYRRDYELMSGNTRFISSFFTHNTNYAFKPYLEVVYDGQKIMDDRMQMTNNRRGRLFLYTFSGNSAANYFSASTVYIKDASNTVVHSGLTPTQMEKGVYYVDVFMSGTSRGQKYSDVWQGVSFNPPYDSQDITQSFSIRDNYYTANIPDVNDYAVDVYGLQNGAILSNDEVIRVFCGLRVNYSLNSPTKSYNLKYRLVMNEQEEVIPWTDVNQAVINGEKTNYFLLDTSWLLHNQTYSMQLKIEELGTSRVLPSKTTFKVLRPF